MFGLYLNHFLPRNIICLINNSKNKSNLMIDNLYKKYISEEYIFTKEILINFNKDIEAIPGYTEMINAQKELEQVRDETASSVAKPKTGFLTFIKIVSTLGIIIGIIITIILWYEWEDIGEMIPGIATAVIALILRVISGSIKSKKKKQYNSQQANIEMEFDEKLQSINEKHSGVVSAVEAVNKNITPLQNRIDEIDNELTRPR